MDHSLIVLVCTLIYTLYGGLRASIFTDNIQSVVILALLLISGIYLILFTGDKFSFSYIAKENPNLLSAGYIPNYTSGINFLYCCCGN